MHQELMHALSIWVRNWCMHWAYMSGTNASTERSPFKTCWAYTSGTDAYPEHTHHYLMRILSVSVKIPNLKRFPQNMLIMCIRNWWVHLAYASGTDACTVRSACASEIKWCLAAPKIKATSLYLSPKVTNPERLYGVKIMKIRAIKISHLGTLNIYNLVTFWQMGHSDIQHADFQDNKY